MDCPNSDRSDGVIYAKELRRQVLAARDGVTDLAIDQDRSLLIALCENDALLICDSDSTASRTINISLSGHRGPLKYRKVCVDPINPNSVWIGGWRKEISFLDTRTNSLQVVVTGI